MDTNAVPPSELPSFLGDILRAFVGENEQLAVLARLRPGAMKATRLSFANVLARRMIEERWAIRRERLTCDEEGDGYGVYRIDAGGYPLTYIARCFRWD